MHSMFEFLFTRTPLLFMVQSFWRDEGFSYYMAHMSIMQMIQITAKDFNPPLYYILLHMWINVFGTTEIAMRSLSFIFYIATIYVFYMFITDVLKVSSRIHLFFYLVIMAFNPVLLYYAFEVRMYSLVGLFAMISYYFFFQKKWWLYTFVTVLGLYTHYYFIFVVLAQCATLVFGHKNKVRNELNLLKFPLIGVGFFAPWLLYISKWFFGQTQSFWMEKLTITRFLTLPGVLFTGYESSGYYQYYDAQIGVFTVIIVAIVGFLLWNTRRHRDKKTLAIAWWAFLGYFVVGSISLFKPIFVPRYLLFCSIGLTAFLVTLLNKARLRIQIAVISILLIMIAHYTTSEVQFKTKGDLRATIHQISYIAGKNDLLYVTDAANYFVASYYFGEKHVYVYQKKENIPSYVGISAIPDGKITEVLPQYPKKAFILTSDYNYEIKTASF